ncbi:MAG: GntR family transcriptional regulator [Pseudomonadota bacterium]
MTRLVTDTPAPDDATPPATVLDAHEPAPDAAGASQTAQALQRVRDLILTGDIEPGSRLTELALVERLGVSRTPIRAALQKLESEGLLDAMPNGRGYRLRQFSKADIWDAIEIHATMEGLAARMAAERGVEDPLMEQARELLARIDTLLEVPLTTEAFAAYMACNEAFHALIGRMSGSPMVMRQLQRSCHHPFAAPGTFLLAQAHLPEARGELLRAQDQHHAIIDAIQRREGSRVEALVREHARLFGRNLLRVVKLQQALKLVPGSVKGLL